MKGFYLVYFFLKIKSFEDKQQQLSSNLEERCQQLQVDSSSLRANLAGLTNEHTSLKDQFIAQRDKLFAKGLFNF